MLPFLLLAVLLGSGDEKIPVKGVTTVSGSYCGGVAPPPGLITELATPKVDSGVRLRLYRGKAAQGEALEVKSDAKGRFELVLTAGDWCVVDGRRQIQPGSKPVTGADAKCWAAASVGCDAIWAIDRIDGKAPPQLVLHYTRSCGWDPPCGPHIAPPP